MGAEVLVCGRARCEAGVCGNLRGQVRREEVMRRMRTGEKR